MWSANSVQSPPIEKPMAHYEVQNTCIQALYSCEDGLLHNGRLAKYSTSQLDQLVSSVPKQLRKKLTQHTRKHDAAITF